MAARSLNKVLLIGNLTRDPELRYTPSGTAVCTFGLATNRQWVTESGERKEDAEFHRIVSWQKLAEICGKFLSKGRKIYIEGRIQTRTWTGQDGQQRTTTEIVIDDMIILDSRRDSGTGASGYSSTVQRSDESSTDETSAATTDQPEDEVVDEIKDKPKPEKDEKKKKKAEKPADKKEKKEDVPQTPAQQSEDVSPDDIPF